jgi:dihydropteroate synthase
VAFECIQLGANIINDVSGGRYDPEILKVAARYQVPYITMHSRGTPETMNSAEHLHYQDIVKDMSAEIEASLRSCREAGILEYSLY